MRYTPIKDLTGQRFARLIIIKRVENGKHGNVRWLCKCDCGNTKIVNSSHLIRGEVRSCGCLKNKEKLIGKRFGRLLVISRTNRRNNKRSVIWKCKCNCGNITYVATHELKKGVIRSCGCLRDETKIENLKKGQQMALYKGTRITALTRPPQRNNTTGIQGVSIHTQSKKWRARITFRGKEIHLGLFDTKEEAIKARREAEEKYFKPIIEEFNGSKEANR